MRKIRLLGYLGEKFGSEHSFQIKSPAEAVRALVANYKEFARDLLKSDANGVGYQILVGDDAIDPYKELHYPSGENTISIVPVITGAGGVFESPVFRIITGAALIAFGALVDLGTLGAATPVSGIVIGIGVGLALGGIAQLLTPIPKRPDLTAPSNNPSYVFNGAVNTTAQGHPVPIGYGRMIVGSAVISAGITVEEIPIDT